MREKKWKHCPACGAKNSMRQKTGLTEQFHPRGYPPLDIDNLEGQFCEQCGDGFWSLKSTRRITSLLTKHRAAHDANRIVAAELASVREAAQALHITTQGIHKMMDEGRLRYVVAGGRRLPIRSDLTEKGPSQSASLPGQ